jgi:hypothetical protein
MTAPTTATVETLTAEVHVLKVGNRQITLSVAKQLDVIPFDRLRPFGRIHLGDRDGAYYAARSTAGLFVIGADIETGALCLSLVNHGTLGCTEAQYGAARALPLIVLAGLK